jgi:hypothetical protein
MRVIACAFRNTQQAAPAKAPAEGDGHHPPRQGTSSEPNDGLVAIAMTPTVVKPAIPFAAKRSPATVSAVHYPAAKSLVAVPPTANGCDRESPHESVAVLVAPAS